MCSLLHLTDEELKTWSTQWEFPIFTFLLNQPLITTREEVYLKQPGILDHQNSCLDVGHHESKEWLGLNTHWKHNLSHATTVGG